MEQMHIFNIGRDNWEQIHVYALLRKMQKKYMTEWKGANQKALIKQILICSQKVSLIYYSFI